METNCKYYSYLFLLLTALFVFSSPVFSAADENTTIKKPLQEQNTDNRQDDLKKLDKAIADNPRDADAFFERGKIYNSLEEQQKAINDFNHVIELKPASAEAYLERGKARADSGKYEEALRDLNKALDLNPQLKEAYIQRGHVYGILGNNEDAEIDYQRAIELNPQKTQATPKPAAVKNNSRANSKPALKARAKIKKIIVVGNRDTKNYHLPGMKYYKKVKKHHRVVFRSEQDAIRAGYHKAPQ